MSVQVKAVVMTGPGRRLELRGFDVPRPEPGGAVIETVASQAWSAKVGMYGVSYAGIMQLLVAATRPPSLAAIAPLSVLDQVGSVLYPGGIYNDGFAQLWTEQVATQAQAYGQGWERPLVEAGDSECGANQRLRSHNPDLLAMTRAARSTPSSKGHDRL